MGVQLRPMRHDEFAAWLPKMQEDYGQAMINDAGFPPESAQEQAAKQLEQLFPGRQPSDDQLVFVVEADGEPVGELWLAQREDFSRSTLFVYDVHISEAHRGKGYGKAAMLLAEEEARRRGIGRVALNVFGRNAVARRLYLSLGYEENAVAMSKSVDAD